MSKTPKTLCSWKKEEIKDDLDTLREIVKDPRFICAKCGRAAHDEQYLCKPKKL
jgi:hypothetical protein